jgi:hypothetical protein
VSGNAQAVQASYVLPLSSDRTDADLDAYLDALVGIIDDVVVVDSSPDPVFAANRRRWPCTVRQVRPRIRTPNGKVGGVLVGLELAHHDAVVIADDDVRWDAPKLRAAVAALPEGGVVRPQNVFVPAPWHARWDTGRILVNRVMGGDWPGTLVVDRRALPHGYHGASLFENLELVRTVRAGGGTEVVLLDLIVDRRPPTARHFLGQRPRQAYDEWARPVRLLAQLAIAPALILGRWRAAVLIGSGAVAMAEMGRRRAGGRAVWPPSASLWALAWVGERSVTSWCALWARWRGGAPYRDQRLPLAARSIRQIRRGAVPF